MFRLLKLRETWPVCGPNVSRVSDPVSHCFARNISHNLSDTIQAPKICSDIGLQLSLPQGMSFAPAIVGWSLTGPVLLLYRTQWCIVGSTVLQKLLVDYCMVGDGGGQRVGVAG